MLGLNPRNLYQYRVKYFISSFSRQKNILDVLQLDFCLKPNEVLIVEHSFISRLETLTDGVTFYFGSAFIVGDLHLIIYIRPFSHTLKGSKRNNS